MIEIYADLVQAGLRSLESGGETPAVPAKYLGEVVKELATRANETDK